MLDSISRALPAAPIEPVCAVRVTCAALTSAAASPVASRIEPWAVSATLPAVEVIEPTCIAPAVSSRTMSPSAVASTWLPTRSVRTGAKSVPIAPLAAVIRRFLTASTWAAPSLVTSPASVAIDTRPVAFEMRPVRTTSITAPPAPPGVPATIATSPLDSTSRRRTTPSVGTSETSLNPTTLARSLRRTRTTVFPART